MEALATALIEYYLSQNFKKVGNTMHTIQYDWKEYNVNWKAIDTWLREDIASSYVGLSANSKLELHFEEEPSAETKAAIDAMWDAITEEAEAAKWTHSEALASAETDARESVLTADWNDMIPAERKIAMNRPLSESDRESLLTKYPQ